MDAIVEDYLTDRQCARQWKTVLRTLAGELSERLPPDDLRLLMQGTGRRFAQEQSLGACQTLDDLQLAISRVWYGLDWGWVELTEREDGLHIQHRCSPLHSAFGPAGLPWAGAFLEGAYQAWFEQLGASTTGLQVSLRGVPDASGSVALMLGRAA